MRQKQPTTLNEAVTSTLEMESYLIGASKQSIATVDQKETSSAVADVTATQEKRLTSLVEKLVERI